MGKKVLVVYASKAGSTAEVAEEVGRSFSEAGAEVDVMHVKKVRNLNPYDAVVIGTAVRFEKPLSEAVSFAKKFRTSLAGLPVACFSVGAWMRQNTPENREKTIGFLALLLKELKEPVSVGMFGGKIDYSELSIIWRTIASHDDTGLMDEGDWRDWEDIRKWTHDLTYALKIHPARKNNK